MRDVHCATPKPRRRFVVRRQISDEMQIGKRWIILERVEMRLGSCPSLPGKSSALEIEVRRERIGWPAGLGPPRDSGDASTLPITTNFYLLI